MPPKLSQEYLRQLFRYDKRTGHLYWRVFRRGTIVPGKRAGRLRSSGYRYVKIDQRDYREHRVIWCWMTGKWPRNIDHKDLNRAHNAWENLRKANDSLNGANHPTPGCCGTRFRGVKKYQTSANRVRWQARLCVKKQELHLGMFDTAEEAARVRDKHAKIHFGEFATLNFP